MNITHTITVLELIWTVVAALGLLFNLNLLLRSVDDMNWLINTKANGDHGLRKYVAVTSILIFAGGVGTQLSYTAVGIIAMTQASNKNDGHPTTAQICVSAIFITASLLGTTLAGFIYARRSKVVKLVAERLEKSA